MDRIRIYDNELDAFIDAIKSKFHYDYSSFSRMNLKYSIERLLNKRKSEGSIKEMINSIKTNDQWKKFQSDLLVLDTELFRNPALFRYYIIDDPLCI